MNGQQIADELGITRQAVSKILQKAVNKIYNRLEGEPTEKLMNIYKGLDIKDEKDMKAIYKLLPKSDRDNISNKLKKSFYIKD